MTVTQTDDSAEKRRENCCVLFELILNAIHDEQYSCFKDRLCRCIKKEPNQNAKKFFRFLDKKLTIYLDIALIMEFKNRGVEIIDKNDLVQYLMQLPGLADGSDRFFESIVRVLVQDCCELMYTKPDFRSVEPQISMKNYFSFCSTGETKAVYDATEKYCNPLNWFRQDEKNDMLFHVSYQRFSKANLDYFSDLLLFENIGKAV